MSGMPGEVDEQPARRSAVACISMCLVDKDRADYSHNNTIAMAMNIMRTW